MKVYFTCIGVLLSYNLSLPKMLSTLGVEVYIDAEVNLTKYFLFREKLLRRFKPKLCFLSMFSKFLSTNSLAKRLKNFDILHVNAISDYTKKVLRLGSGAKILVLHTAPLPEELYSEIGDYVDVFVAPSNFTLKCEKLKMRKYTNKPMVVIHHGIDTSFFNTSISVEEARKKLGLPANRKVVLWNDRISPEKDLKTFLKAIPLIAREVPDTLFYIKGRALVRNYYNQIKKDLRDITKRYKVKVHIGWIPQEKLPLLYRAADVFVRTSLHENFGLGYIEAMACGVPVVASDIETAKEVVNDVGLLYKSKDPYDLAEKVVQVLTDKDLKEKLTLRGIRRVKEHFTSDIMAKQYLQLYISLIGCK